MDLHSAIDFLITTWGDEREWMIFRQTVAPEHCVRVCATESEAQEKALLMAQYHVAAGHDAQVHVRRREGDAWQTVWHALGSLPRFPCTR